MRLGNRDIPALTVAWVGDSTNVLHDMLVTYPRLGHSLRVATPKDPKYAPPPAVLARVKELGCDKGIVFTHDPKEAVRKADIVMTDTWISMGQEAEKAKRLAAFRGFQVTEELCKGANPNWVFMHCLPRKPEEVSDEVRSARRLISWLLCNTPRRAGVQRQALRRLPPGWQPVANDSGHLCVRSHRLASNGTLTGVQQRIQSATGSRARLPGDEADPEGGGGRERPRMKI